MGSAWVYTGTLAIIDEICFSSQRELDPEVHKFSYALVDGYLNPGESKKIADWKHFLHMDKLYGKG